MTPKKASFSKGKFLITIYFFTSSLMSAQVKNYTYDDSKSVSSGNNYGKLIMEMPFGAILYRNPYIKAQDLLDNLKNQCKGKAIFIDFWATWCTPCIEAMPNAKRLFIETKKLPIEFIYICTDNRTSLDNWITKISVLKQPGIHIFVEDEIIRQLWGSLPVGGGFPSYIFIDSTGDFRPEAIPLNTSTTAERLSGLIKK